jgi:hypothetical protein
MPLDIRSFLELNVELKQISTSLMQLDTIFPEYAFLSCLFVIEHHLAVGALARLAKRSKAVEAYFSRQCIEKPVEVSVMHLHPSIDVTNRSRWHCI